jgi:Tetratricopeptide repeat
MYLRAKIFLQMQKPDRAILIYQDILKRDPKDYAALQFMNMFDGKI